MNKDDSCYICQNCQRKNPVPDDILVTMNKEVWNCIYCGYRNYEYWEDVE